MILRSAYQRGEYCNKEVKRRATCSPIGEGGDTTLFQASWLSFEAFTSLMRIGFLYYNCLGFDLASDYTDIVLNTV